MHILIVFAHPTRDSFTGDLLEAFHLGPAEAGHSWEATDLSAEGFNPILAPEQFALETGMDSEGTRPVDVMREHTRLDRAEGLAWASGKLRWNRWAA